MATYLHLPYAHSDRGAGPGNPDPKCDDCSTFDPDGFASDDRSWTPIWGEPCSKCGQDC